MLVGDKNTTCGERHSIGAAAGPQRRDDAPRGNVDHADVVGLDIRRIGPNAGGVDDDPERVTSDRNSRQTLETRAIDDGDGVVVAIRHKNCQAVGRRRNARRRGADPDAAQRLPGRGIDLEKTSAIKIGDINATAVGRRGDAEGTACDRDASLNSSGARVDDGEKLAFRAGDESPRAVAADGDPGGFSSDRQRRSDGKRREIDNIERVRALRCNEGLPGKSERRRQHQRGKEDNGQAPASHRIVVPLSTLALSAERFARWRAATAFSAVSSSRPAGGSLNG